MNNGVLISCIIMLFCVAISGFSQILLKKSALKNYESKIKEFLNPYVIVGYSLFLFCTFVSVLCYKYVPLTLGTVIESTGYIFVPVLSFIFLKEKLNTKQLIGVIIVLIGVVLFAIGGN